MILALRESRSARRDSRRAWNATRLVTYFWAVLYISKVEATENNLAYTEERISGQFV